MQKTAYELRISDWSSDVCSSDLANWDAPANVHAFTTLRCGAGSSQAPFDEFNLGNARAADGDDPAVVARNRAELIERAGLPSPLRWLRQVHGTRVLRFGEIGRAHV